MQSSTPIFLSSSRGALDARLPGDETLLPSWRWLLFALLVALMLTDFFVRQIVVSMFPHLKVAWNLTDAELGGLVSVVAVTVALATIPLSYVADRIGHARSIFVMALLWSMATIACAYAPGYASLFGARALVGVGEAAYGAVGAALLAGIFPERVRSRVLGVFLSGSLIGSFLGIAFGGAMADRWGWQNAFAAAGLPGIVVAMLFLWTARVCTRRAPPFLRNASARATLPRALSQVIGTRTIRFACAAGGLQLLCTFAVYAWLPSFVHRVYGIAPDQAGLWAGYVVIIGVPAAFLWSALADALTRRVAGARFVVSAVAVTTTGAMVLAAFGLCEPGTAQITVVVIAAAAMTGTVGPLAAAVMDVVSPALRATAASMLALAQNLLGAAAGPFVTGWLSDRYGLDIALAAAGVFPIAAAGLLVVGRRAYVTETQNAASHQAPAVHAAQVGGVPKAFVGT